MTAGLGVGWVSAGNLDQLNYFDVPGTRVADLRTSPNNTIFPASPGTSFLVGTERTQLINPNLTIPPETFIQTTGQGPQNSATWVRGFVEPPQTGEYTFWVSGSDDAELWLNPAGPSSAGKQMVAFTGGSTGANVWAQRLTQKSAVFVLTKGQQYYFELIQKTAGSPGGNASIGWFLPDKTLQRPLPIRYAQRFAYQATCSPGTGLCSGSWVNERAIAVAEFDRHPGTSSSVVIAENQPLDLTPWISANYPRQFQWQELVGYVNPSNPGTPSNLAGEITSTRYIERIIPAQHHNKTYRLRVSNGGSSVDSNPVTITVINDTTRPTIASASTAGNLTGFNVVFSEPVNPTTATNKANYSVNGLTVDRVEMRYGITTNNNTVVVYTTTSLDNPPYTVTVDNVTDLAATPNAIAAPNNTRAISLTDGIISYFAYGAINGGDAIGGTAIANLLAATNRYPNSPDLSTTRTEMGIPLNVADNYGARLVGFLVPPQTGLYNFVIAADDQAVVYISPNQDPAAKVAVAVEPQWNGFRNYTTNVRRCKDGCDGAEAANGAGDSWINANFGNGYPGNRPAHQSKFTRGGTQLTAGNKYFIEALMKEGGGGDNLDVTWQLPGTWNLNDNTGLSNGQAPVPGEFLSLFSAAGQAGPIVIDNQPASQTAQENKSVNFLVVHRGSPSFTYQWYRNGSIIPDANAQQLTVPLPSPATDDGAQYQVLIRNLFSQQWSSNATLTVVADTNKPTVVRAYANAGFNKVTISFNEVIDPATATNPNNYTIVNTNSGAGLTILSTPAVLSGAANGGFTNVTFTTAQQAEGAKYRITINNVKDISVAGNAVEANTTVIFSGWILSRGFARYDEYWNITGGGADGVRSDPRYPDSPNNSRFLTLWDAPTDFRDSFGGRISGFIIPPYTGQYTFYMYSDDNGGFWLSSNDTPGPVTRIATEPAWNGYRDWVGTDRRNASSPENISSPQNLTAGVRRYAELVYLEGGGGDRGGATWRVPAQNPAVPEQNPPVNGQASRLTGNVIATFANPDETTFTYTTQPTDQNSSEGLTVTFTAAGSGTTMFDPGPPTFWRWQRKAPGGSSFADIPNAFGTSYTTPALTPSDNGAEYRAMASIPGKETPSNAAVLTVVTDTVAPLVTAVSGVPPAPPATAQNKVRVYFSERVQAGLATDVANYTITGPGGSSLAVTGATLSADGRVAELTTAAQTAGTQYNISVKDIRDPSLAANLLSPNPTVKTFTAWSLQAGLIKRERYYNLNGARLANMTNAAKFPDSPDQVDFVDVWGSTPNQDNYGTRLTGWVVPTATDDYHFAISGDDSCVMFVSTDENPANKRVIAEEPEWNGYRNWNGTDRRINNGNATYFRNVTTLPVNRSQNTIVTPLNLVAGNRYYVEVLHKEGGGGDNVGITWWPASGAMPANDTGPLGGNVTSSYVNPDNTANITAHPTSRAVDPGQNTTFNVTASPTSPMLGGPLSYQWRFNGTPIGGATGSSYTVNNVQQANAGTYDVLINGPGFAAPVASNPATLSLTVIDVTLTITRNGNNVTVSYPANAQAAGHELQATTTLTPAAFAADPGAVNGANYERTKDVTSGDNQTYWRTRKP